MPGDAPFKRISLRDIAKQVGVSHVTISLGLRNDPRIPPERCKQIQRAAERLGYRPDPMLSSLAVYRQAKRVAVIRSTMAWFNQWAKPKELRSFLEFDAYWRGARESAERLGYRLDEFVLKPDMTGPRLQKILTTRNVRGILIPPHRDGLNLPDFDWSLFSIVRFGASVRAPRAHIVTSDQTKCATLAFTRMRERGYQRIGYVTSIRLEQNTEGFFRAGYLSSQDSLVPPLPSPLTPLVLNEDASSADLPVLREWLNLASPDAIITSVSRVPRLLAEAGYKVPRDVAVATLSVLDGNVDSGIDQNSIEIGRVASSTLASLIHQNERGVPQTCRRILVEGTWVDGKSVPAAKARPTASSG